VPDRVACQNRRADTQAPKRVGAFYSFRACLEQLAKEAGIVVRPHAVEPARHNS
jgi:hypothetical protein